MGELVKAFQKFLMRDLSYIIGGAAVILSFLYAFDRLPGEATSPFWYVLGVAFAYVLGYAIRRITWPVPHNSYEGWASPQEFASWLYKCYDRTLPRSFKKAEYDNGKLWLYTSAPQRFRDDHERIEGLKQVAFAVGPCLLISGIVIPDT